MTPTSPLAQNTPSKTNYKHPRRTISRLLIALIAVGIGLFAQSLFQAQSLWDGIVFYGLALSLFAYALRPVEQGQSPWVTPYRGLFAGLGLDKRPLYQIAGRILIIAALVTMFLSTQAFAEIATMSRAWQLYWASVLLFIFGILLMTKGPVIRTLGPFSSSRETRRATSLALGGILLLALGLRLWQFGELPFGVWFDEAEAGLQARRWLDELLYKPPFYHHINISGHLIWLYSLGLRFVSDSVLGLRLISVLFGVGGVWAAYLFGREVRGREFGLILAFCMAVMRWDINFSRIAMTGIDTPFFIFLSLFFLTRLFKRGNLRDAAFAGLSLGFGLNFYTAFRLYILALGLILLLGIFIWRQWCFRLTAVAWLGRNLTRGLIIMIALWIAWMPVGQYALNNPNAFGARVETTSIFNRRDDPDLARALRTNFLKHLAMFHIEGDHNGRHNLPGEPMLDPVMGALVLLGLGLGLQNSFSRSKRPDTLLFLLLLPISLIGGIFTLDFEAPQSLRSIAAVPTVGYFCSLAVSSIAIETRKSLRPLPPQWLLLPLGLIGGGYMFILNTHTYFVRQAEDFAVWNAFSTPETITGRKMAELGPSFDMYLSPFLTNHPSVRFISPHTLHHQTIPLPDALPIRSEAVRHAALFIHPDDGWVYEEAQRLYPTGQFETVSITPGGPPAVHIGILSAHDIASIQGISLLYWSGSEKQTAQMPLQTLKVDTIDVDWQNNPPLDPPYLAEWRGVLYVAQYGTYHLQVTAPASVTLEIDGLTLISGVGQQQATWELAKGNHTLRLLAHSGPGKVQLLWTPPYQGQALVPTSAFYTHPVTNNGLLGRYYPNANWQGPPALVKIDPFLNAYYHLIPLQRPYSVAWQGVFQAPVTGVYHFALRSVGPAKLFIDQEQILHNDLPHDLMPHQVLETAVSLPAGLHEIEVLFQDIYDRSRLHLYWRMPNEIALQPLPRQYLWPRLNSVPQTNLQLVEARPDFEAQTISLTYLNTLSEGLVQPRDIAVGPQETVYIVDSGVKAVRMFREGLLVGGWSQAGDGEFVEPFALVATQDGRLWVLDAAKQWIYSFDANGNPLGQFGGPEAKFYFPRGLAVLTQEGTADILAVADTGSGRVLLYDTTGQFLSTFGSFGEAPGQLNEPVDILRDVFGAYFITEGANIKRWQRLDPLGRPLSVWALDTPDAHDGSHLAGLADGSILMTNADSRVLRRYAPNGNLLSEWQTIGPISFKRPVGIFVDETRSMLYVSDITAGEVYEFAIGY